MQPVREIKSPTVIGRCSSDGNWNIYRFLSWLLSMTESIWLSGAIQATRLYRSATNRYVYLKSLLLRPSVIKNNTSCGRLTLARCLRRPPPAPLSVLTWWMGWKRCSSMWVQISMFFFFCRTRVFQCSSACREYSSCWASSTLACCPLSHWRSSSWRSPCPQLSPSTVDRHPYFFKWE